MNAASIAQEEAGVDTVRYWSPWLAVYALVWLCLYLLLAPAPVEFFESNWYFILVGLGAGVLGNISAVGGGLVFIPVMIFLSIPPVEALRAALASQAIGMTSGAIGWLQQKTVPFKALYMTVPGLILGSSVSSLLIHPNALLVKGLFGPVSISLGLLTLLTLRKDQGRTTNEIPDSAWLPMLIVSFLGGLITGWVAIGEGELVAALLMLRYGLNIRSAVGLGVLLLAINSIYLTAIHSIISSIPWEIAGFTVLGCVYGARLAPFISQFVSQKVLKVSFAAIAIGDGILFLVQFML